MKRARFESLGGREKSRNFDCSRASQSGTLGSMTFSDPFIEPVWPKMARKCGYQGPDSLERCPEDAEFGVVTGSIMNPVLPVCVEHLAPTVRKAGEICGVQVLDG